MVGGVLYARMSWFDNHMRVDPCSVLARTGGSSFVENMDWRVRHLFVEGYPVHDGCTRLFPRVRIPHVEFVRVELDGEIRVVQLIEHGRGIGSLLHEYRAAPGALWSVRIDPPVSMTDQLSAPIPPP